MGALYIVSEVLTTPSALQGFDWYILPVVNPDGLVFSQKEVKINTDISFLMECLNQPLQVNFSYF